LSILQRIALIGLWLVCFKSAGFGFEKCQTIESAKPQPVLLILKQASDCIVRQAALGVGNMLKIPGLIAVVTVQA